MKKRKSKSSRVLKAERDAAARLILPKRYYKGRDDKAFFEPVCMIRPPENIEELAGYVSVIPQKYIPEGNALMKKLMGLGTEMEQACTDVIKKYQDARCEEVFSDILELTGIDMHSNIAKKENCHHD